MSEAKTSAAPATAVLIAGSGYGALKVAEDLAQSGIPAVWVTRAQHFLELPAGMEYLPEWPEDLSFQFRPLYLRVTRHPLVTPLTRSRIESIEKTGDNFRVVVEQDPHFIDYDLCSGCGRCMEICPLRESPHPPLTRTPAYCPSRALELLKRPLSPCRLECPLGVNVQAYLALTAAGRFEEALAVIREDNPLPSICGRVCPRPCEASCRRRELDQPLAIRDIKRFLADYVAEHGSSLPKAPPPPRRRERVAVVGSGPAGLTAAHFLCRAGFPVTIFEELPEPGGMLRCGIPAYRLPRDVLDREIQDILAAGVELRAGVRVGREISFDQLGQEFDIIFLAVGAHQSYALNIPGEDAEGVLGAVEMLRAYHLGRNFQIGKKVAVIGGGNSAMDAARTAIRLGADSVTIYYRRERKDMPAQEPEIQAAEAEGVEIEYLVGPAQVKVTNSKVSGLQLIRMKLGRMGPDGRRLPEPIPGSEFLVEADTIISAISQAADLEFLPETSRVEKTRNAIKVDEASRTSRPGVSAAGDGVTGPSSVIAAMASGRRAAAEIIEHLTGEPLPFGKLPLEPRGVGDPLAIAEDVPQQPRQEMAQRQPKVRRRDFEEVDFGFTADQAMAEAKRCLQCSGCCECRVCDTACAEVGAIDHFRNSKRFEFFSPGVIVADDQEMPSGEFQNDEGVYRVGELKKDIMDLLVAGSAAAGRVMAQAKELRTSAVPELTGIQDLSGPATLGVFICTCNGTMAPAGVLERIQALAESLPGVVHADLIFSACHPRGSDRIAAAVKKHRLTRAILASCVCCPLEFECISCNDQRTRPRIHLFDRHGLDRSSFEMINIRDHLRPEVHSEDEILAKAREFLRAALIRTRFMGPLRQGITEIGKNILILGGSEIGLSCALNLDLQGFRVRLVHNGRLKGESQPADRARKRAPSIPLGQSISQVKEAVIEDIRGHIGNFTVVVREGGKRRRWRADIVCLTDENVLPLAIPEDMAGLKKFYRYDFAFFHSPQPGLYRVLPRTLDRVNAFEAGAALAAQVAGAAAEAFLKDHELSPHVDPERCRGCGRCAEICPFHAVTMVPGPHGIYTAEVLRHNCVGCGGCVGRCPVTALDVPYFSNRLLEEIVAGTWAGER